MKVYVYAIWFPTSEKSNPYYIGITENLERRMLQHLNSGSLICKALWKYDDWQVSILHTCKTRDEANHTEIEEIRNFNSIASNGYNLTRGGDGSNGFEGHKHSEEMKKKMGERMQGKQTTKGKHWKLSEKTIEKMRGNKNAEGFKHTEAWKKENSKRMQGENNSMYMRKNPNAHSIQSEIKRLKTRIKNIEKGL